MKRPELTDDEADAVLEALGYYQLSDYGTGGARPYTDEQKRHINLIKSAMHKIGQPIEAGAVR